MIKYDVQVIGTDNDNHRTFQFTGISAEYIADIVEQMEIEGYVNYTMVVNRVE